MGSASFLTRLIWRSSRVSVVSPAGVAAQFGATAVERGLADPFDPEQAIPKAADLLSSHRQRFGNLDLGCGQATAARTGSRRGSRRAGLPRETRDYVERITCRSAEDWAEDRRAGKDESAAPRPDEPSRHGNRGASAPAWRRWAEAPAGPVAPWGFSWWAIFPRICARRVRAGPPKL